MKFTACFLILLFLPVNEKTSPLQTPNQYSDDLTGQQIRTDIDRYVEMTETILNDPPVVITSNRSTAADGEMNSYVSLACYWWPNPNTENGLPYIRIDGEVNPETRSEKSDLPNLINMAQRIELLSNAFLISGNEKFAQIAVEQLHAWFINPKTSMNPHLKYAQRVKGRNSGRSYGVIDTWWLIRVVDSFQVLKSSKHWSKETDQELKNWFTHYLNWLRNSEFGQEESRSKNNHGTWYDLQIITFAQFTGQTDFAANYLEEVTKQRIAKQITWSGRQKYETRRPRPVHYSIYNLSGALKLAIDGEKLGVDIKYSSRLMGNNLRSAVEYLIDMVDGTDPGNYRDEQDQTETDILYLNLLLDSLQLYGRPDFKNEAARVYLQITDSKPVWHPAIKMLFTDPEPKTIDNQAGL